MTHHAPQTTRTTSQTRLPVTQHRPWGAALALTGALAGLLAATSAQADDYPAETLNYVIAFGPGGGNDLMSRTVVDILNKYDLYGEHNIVVSNREGGSGAVGFSYVKNKEGSPYYMTSTSGNFISTPLVSNTDWNYQDFTPIALLANDAMLIVVNADSEIETLDDFVEKARSERLTVGGIGAAGPDRVVARLLKQAADIDFEYVPSQDGGQVVTSLTSSSVDAIISNPSEVAGQIEAGNFRPLAYSEPQRSSVYPDIPTFEELGYAVSFSLPRGVVMPKEIPDSVQEWWVDTLQQVVATPEWESYLTTNSLSGNTIWGEDFGRYLIDTNAKFADSLK
ncbi:MULTISPECIES: Bug family tripartite tricarboxylate transporter substrate binding protein [unclassified Halomonas]|uniref:Bug family tripartite tricarboxylate transporter substrate binding protein n=1 Tax=Halomonas TaxID=2745 RepID=UPI001C950312|nr:MULTISPECIES: tripartite tricarboxylate transporter substrate binding protein [unclassified Halomonas]MBY5924419.1 tripartite tricarboxylate transporter substrate binding protein [Halomonas sp. DP4Y7-2]MBY6231461.1 tripartite tricarboxylate transporter substrate binding protein [Halomonas sp. DP4Y7-1]